MALITSAATGNFSAGATWTGGVVPGVGDEARASTGHTVTIDVDTTCDEVSNAGTGIFTLASGVTLTANVTNKTATGARNCLQFTAASPGIGYIVGNCVGGSASSCSGAVNTSSGTLSITGNCIGGSAIATQGALNSSTGTLLITGDATGGTGSNAYGAGNSSTGTLTITGNATGGSGSGAWGCNNNSTGTLAVTGNATGGSGSTAFGCNNNSTGTLAITGIATGGTTNGAPGVNAANAAGTVNLGRAKGNDFGIGSVGIAAGFGVAAAQSHIVKIKEIEYGLRGMSPTSGPVFIEPDLGNLAIFVEYPTGSKTLSDPNDTAGLSPAVTDVRSGVVYNNGNDTGTCAVPAAASVGFGVPVDATTGTAYLSQSDVLAAVWGAATTSLTTAGSIGALLATNIDATISSRSTATTAGIAAAVWDEVLTGATHNVSASAGRRLRQLGDERIIAEGTVQSATTGTITIEDVGTLCVGQTIVVTDQSTGDKQTRFILAFDTGTDTATVDSNWCVIPTAGDEYLLTTVRDPLVTRVDHPTGTVGAEIDEMYLLQGLKDGETLTVTPTSRTAGAVSQTIGGDGTTTTTVSRD
jgi:hypothetical protein